mmetsp:Transcript_90283/g.254786  ORF Transcript_90283/g.254786 Transcript_90283/m.254786 type:complete len:289 (-) Transcript_90283:222-1088(-)
MPPPPPAGPAPAASMPGCSSRPGRLWSPHRQNTRRSATWSLRTLMRHRCFRHSSVRRSTYPSWVPRGRPGRRPSPRSSGASNRASAVHPRPRRALAMDRLGHGVGLAVDLWASLPRRPQRSRHRASASPSSSPRRLPRQPSQKPRHRWWKRASTTASGRPQRRPQRRRLRRQSWRAQHLHLRWRLRAASATASGWPRRPSRARPLWRPTRRARHRLSCPSSGRAAPSSSGRSPSPRLGRRASSQQRHLRQEVGDPRLPWPRPPSVAATPEASRKTSERAPSSRCPAPR